MLQGLDIPWGVMVDTWDLTFSSMSDMADVHFLLHQELSLKCNSFN